MFALIYETNLYVADKANRTISFQLVSGNGIVTLRLACPVTVQRPSPIINMSPVLGQDPWPLVVDNAQTAGQIGALKVTSSAGGTKLGLTQLKGPEIDEDRRRQKAQFGGGWCVWVSAMTIKYEPIKMFIASKYKPGSCEYEATKAHENLHYQDFSVLARKSQQQMKEAGVSARLPSTEQPWYVQDEAEADRLIGAVVKQAFNPIVSQLKVQGEAKAAERDTTANVDAVLRQCIGW